MVEERVGRVGHDSQGTHFGPEAAEGFRIRRHGADGALFLDPYFLPYVIGAKGKVVADIGAGTAPWAIVAAQNGARYVHSLDINNRMLDQAKTALSESATNVSKKVGLLQGDAATLPYPDESLDLALSINLVSNLPSLLPHFLEMYRTVKRGELAIVTVPASLGDIFTTGNKLKGDILSEIAMVLADIGPSIDPSEIASKIGALTDINGATFAFRNNVLVLIQDAKQLDSGEPIWRKIPAGAIPNYAHSESETESAAVTAGFEIVKSYKESFKSRQEWERHNASLARKPGDRLGEEYIGKNRYAVYVLKKN